MINLEGVFSRSSDKREPQYESFEIESKLALEKLPLGLLNKFSEMLSKRIGAENLRALMYMLTEFLLDPKKLVQNIPLLETIFEIIRKRINEAYSKLSENEKLAKFINYLINLSEKYLKTLKESREVCSSKIEKALFLMLVVLFVLAIVGGYLIAQQLLKELKPLIDALSGKFLPPQQ